MVGSARSAIVRLCCVIRCDPWYRRLTAVKIASIANHHCRFVGAESMSTLPDFEGLAMFAMVAEERSFAGAARALNVSVATVSRAVARLEERLGARLLNRTSRQLALTEFGQMIAESAMKVYREAEAAEGAAREMSARPRGL